MAARGQGLGRITARRLVWRTAFPYGGVAKRSQCEIGHKPYFGEMSSPLAPALCGLAIAQTAGGSILSRKNPFLGPGSPDPGRGAGGGEPPEASAVFRFILCSPDLHLVGLRRSLGRYGLQTEGQRHRFGTPT